MKTQKKELEKMKFSKRGFISTGMFISGLGLPITGIMNHYLAFDSITTERHAWMSAHNILGIFFILFAVFHIIYNWKGLIKYINNSVEAIISKEAVAALSVVLFFLVLVILHTFHTD